MLRTRVALAILAFCASTATIAAGPDRVPLTNWPIANAVPTAASYYIAVAPCRVYDSRVAAGGPGPISGGTSRTIQIASGPCAGIPSNAAAFSLNVTVTNSTPGPSYAFITAYPAGTTRPTVSTVNFLAGAQVANAAMVPAGTGGAIDIYASTQTDVIVDINGYFREGVVSSVTPGTGLAGGGSGNVTLGLDTTGASAGQMLTFNGSTTSWVLPITQVSAGSGLTGGGTSGPVSLAANFTPSGGMNGTATTVARGDHAHYAHTVIVPSAGTAAQNGAALLAAIAGITTASATNPYLLKLDAGIYDLGTSELDAVPYVDIEGAGQNVTTITSAPAAVNATVALGGTGPVEIRSLTIAATAGAAFTSAVNITSGAVAPTLRQVTINSSGGTTWTMGIQITVGGGSAINVTDSTINVTSAAEAYGVRDNGTNATINFHRVTMAVTPASSFVGSGVWLAPSASLNVTDSSLTMGFSGFPTTITSASGATVQLLNSLVATNSGAAIDNNDGWVSASSSRLIGTPAIQNANATATRSVIVEHSFVSGAGGPTAISSSSASFDVFIATSRVVGTVTGGTNVCVFSYNGAFAALSSGCL